MKPGNFTFLHFMGMCVLCRSEGNWWESALSFHSVIPELDIRWSGLAAGAVANWTSYRPKRNQGVLSLTLKTGFIFLITEPHQP